jgi:hypothetical protein
VLPFRTDTQVKSETKEKAIKQHVSPSANTTVKIGS